MTGCTVRHCVGQGMNRTDDARSGKRRSDNRRTAKSWREYEGWIRERDEDDGRARSHKMKRAQQEQKLGWVSTPSRRASSG